MTDTDTAQDMREQHVGNHGENITREEIRRSGSRAPGESCNSRQYKDN